MKKLVLLFILFLSMLSVSLYAQESFKVNSQIRPRLILDNRDFSSTTNSNSYTEMRTRLGVSFSPSQDISGFVQLQDSRIWGTEPSTLSNTANVDLHQAYLKINNLFSMPVEFKAGRLELTCGNERLIGVVGWSNIGRAFDGAVLSINSNKIKGNVFYVSEVEKLKADNVDDQILSGAALDFILNETHKLETILIWQRSIPSALLNRFTLGGFIDGKIENFSHMAEAAYQTGEITASGKTLDVAAYMIAYNANYNFGGSLNPSIGAGIDLLSGDENNTDNNYKVFNTLYGTNHKYYGYMDYFINLPVDTYGLGLMDLIGRFSFTPIENLKASANFHIFKSNVDAKLLGGNTSNDFGSELDFVFNYKYNNNAAFEFGFSFFSPGEIFKEKKGKDTSTWSYLMVTVNL